MPKLILMRTISNKNIEIKHLEKKKEEECLMKFGNSPLNCGHEILCETTTIENHSHEERMRDSFGDSLIVITYA